MNNKGNVMINTLMFILALGVVIAFISPINEFLGLASQSDALNCKGYIFDGNVNHSLSFNSTLNGGASGSPIACLALKLYLPYILLVFLVGGVASILAGKALNAFEIEPIQSYQ
jgi:hypothetical protein